MAKVNDKFLSLLGLAAAGGKITSGSAAVLEAIQKRKAHLLLIEAECAENTIIKYKNEAKKANICYYILETNEMGYRIGKPGHKLVCVNDEIFSKALIKHLDSLNNLGEDNNE